MLKYNWILYKLIAKLYISFNKNIIDMFLKILIIFWTFDINILLIEYEWNDNYKNEYN